VAHGWFLGLVFLVACKASPPPPESYAELPSGLLSEEQASVVVAKVGDEVLTLSDYCAILLSMESFQRLRYTTSPEREALLDELINMTLLAQEARRRNLAGAGADPGRGKTAAKTAANTALATALRQSLGNEEALKKLVDDLRKQHVTDVNKSALSAIVVDGTGNVRRAGS